MKQLTCEMCGGTDLIKKDGVFVCQSCGTKYSVEDARNLMMDADGPVTVKVDDTDKLDNYLSMAQGALDNSNNTEAENYCNKILETDQQNYRAWIIKAQAAGWQTTLARPRLDEALSCLEKAINAVPFEELESIAREANDIMQNLLFAMAMLKLDSIVSYPDSKGLMEFLNLRPDLMVKGITVQLAYGTRMKAINEGKSEEDKLPVTSLNMLKFNENLDDKVYLSAIKIWNNMMARYKEDSYPTDYVFDECSKTGTLAIHLLDSVVPNDPSKVKDKDKKRCIKYCEEEIKMKDTLQGLKSYRSDFSGGYESHHVSKTFTQAFKNETAAEIEKLRDVIKQLDPEHVISKTSVEVETEKKAAIAARKQERIANKNKGMNWLFALIGTVLYIVVNRLIVQTLLKSGMRWSVMTSVVVSTIIFTLVITLVAFIGYRFVASHRKNIKLGSVIAWSIILFAIFDFASTWILAYGLGLYSISYIYYMIDFLVAAMVMSIADSKGEIIPSKVDENQAKE